MAQADVDVPPAPAAAAAVDTDPNKSLERLYDYTKFHIGAYLTLTASYLTAVGLNLSGTPVLPLSGTLAGLAVLCFVVAGFAGGVIASSLTQVVSGTSEKFLDSEIGPWGAQKFKGKARTWTYWEHTAFWVGLLIAVLSFPAGKACYHNSAPDAARWCQILMAPSKATSTAAPAPAAK